MPRYKRIISKKQQQKVTKFVSNEQQGMNVQTVGLRLSVFCCVVSIDLCSMYYEW